MSAKTLSLERDICRCCLLEGSFIDLAQPYVYYGKEEVYYDMLKDVFNIEVRPVPGKLCVVTYKICETCIQKLRDAFLFREQVISSEIKFKEMYERSVSEVKSLGLNSFIKEEDTGSMDIKDDISSLNSFGDEDSMKVEDEIDDSTEIFINKFEDVEDDIDSKFDDDEDESIAEIKAKKRTKGKTKPPPESKQKGKRTKKTKDEANDKTEEAECSTPKKKKATSLDETFVRIIEEDGAESYQCKFCESAFKKRSHFSQHYRHVHLKLRPKVRSCHLCNEKVPAYMRAFHMEDVHGHPAPSCGACGKKFAYPFQVLQHQKTYHMGERSFSCSKCDLQFTTQSRLTRHERAHSPTRPYKCAFCDAAFKWTKNLKTHICVHLDERRHVCSFCEMAFVQQSSLKYHLRKHHPETVAL